MPMPLAMWKQVNGNLSKSHTGEGVGTHCSQMRVGSGWEVGRKTTGEENYFEFGSEEEREGLWKVWWLKGEFCVLRWDRLEAI